MELQGPRRSGRAMVNSEEKCLAANLIPTVVLPYVCCIPEGLRAGGGVSLRSASDNKYCENGHYFVKKRMDVHLLWPLFFTSLRWLQMALLLPQCLCCGHCSLLPTSRCTEFFFYISKCLLCPELCSCNSYSKLTAVVVHAEGVPRIRA